MSRVPELLSNITTSFKYWYSPPPVVKPDRLQDVIVRWTLGLFGYDATYRQEPVEIPTFITGFPYVVPILAESSDGFPYTFLPTEGDSEIVILLKWLAIVLLILRAARFLFLVALFIIMSVNSMILTISTEWHNLCVSTWYGLGGWRSWRRYYWSPAGFDTTPIMHRRTSSLG